MIPEQEKAQRALGAAGPKINCNALDKPQFISRKAVRQAQILRDPRAVAANNPAAACRVRLQYLARHLHALGERPLFHFLSEVERGADLRPHFGPPREAGSISDKDFFLANPGCDYRLRLATQDEAARFEQHCGPVPHDWFVYTATKQFFPGMRVRKYSAGLLKDGLGEEAAKEGFEWLERGQ